MTSSRGTIATRSSGTPSLIHTISPSTIGMKPAATYSEWPVPEPKFHAPVSAVAAVDGGALAVGEELAAHA